MSGSKASTGAKVLTLVALTASVAWAATTYNSGAVSSAGLTFGTFQSSGAHASVAGSGGPSKFDATGNTLDGGGDGTDGNPDPQNGRVYMYDSGSPHDLALGTSSRSDATNFAMMIWDFGQPITFVRVYPTQDHLTPAGPSVDTNGGKDVMDSSLWGSNDGDNFVLLNDVTAVAQGGVNGQAPTFTFVGPNQPTTVYRGGSTEHGTANAYCYDVNLTTAYRYIGIRTNSLTLSADSGADVEIDAVATIIQPTTGGGNPYTPGYWHNRNGKAALNAAPQSVFTFLDTLCFWSSDGSAFVPTAADIPGWIQTNGTNMANKLSGMLLCMELNVHVAVGGKTVDPNQMVSVPSGDAAVLGFSQISIGDLMTLAITELCTPGHNIVGAGSPYRAYEAALEDVLDRANNQSNWL